MKRDASSYPLSGIMKDSPLLIKDILLHAERTWPDREVVSLSGDGSTHRTSYGSIFRRCRKLANALNSLGVKPGERIATMAWRLPPLGNPLRHRLIWGRLPYNQPPPGS
ncbi:AMP-binding protein [Sansalvadorimonas sp. 2012CJ34-2]|uniref:AMP-binding protein n=1 Tax=Parendozoicomonas callyspongiae TaxID=2942213 RepID=A0ABT0PDF2_9GAMM|nr:AMP-binding protein [Sansalvadorimonas sp. 2012CJ34-2]MCL6269365.1 AMP-binding protein [Sansalvadorimonas sp. 2012CJ34-2]